MTPIKMFDLWADWKQFGLGIWLGFYDGFSVAIQIAFFTFKFSSKGEPNWKN